RRPEHTPARGASSRTGHARTASRRLIGGSRLRARGYLRDGVSAAEAADVLWVCSSAELYELLVLKRGWSQPRFARYITSYMSASLLPVTAQGGPGGRPAPPEETT
ncbi:hypothetical protein ACIQG8_15205, partial [Pseudarthrobacter oxydans]